MIRFFAVFLLVQLLLFAGELTPWGQEYVVVPFTETIAKISAWLVTFFDPNAVAEGIILRDKESGFAVAIEAGCNGVEATIVLIAAMVAFPSPWKMKLLGIGIGFIAVQVMNLARIITLFYLGQWNMTAFQWAHLYIWQALIMLDVLIVFLVWLRFLPKKQEVAHAA